MTANEDGSQSPRIVTSNIITGTVKWFNVRSGYGFIKRNDNDEDLFVHQTAIIKNNPKKYLRSVGDGETVEFIVIQGAKGPEAAQVTGPNGTHVEGSKYAPERRPRYPRRRPAPRKTVQTGGQDSQGEERDNSDEGEESPNKQEQQPIRRRPRRPYRGGGGQYYRGGYRGRRNGPPRDRDDTREQEIVEPSENSPRNNDYPRRGGPRRRRGGPRRVEGDYGRGEGGQRGEYNESRTYRPRGTGGRRGGRRGRGPPRNPPNENNQNGEDEEPQQQQQGDGSPKQ